MRRGLIATVFSGGAALAGGAAPAHAACPQTNIAILFVSPTGNDAATGLSPATALASPFGAQFKLRQYRTDLCLTTGGPIRVKFAPGEYYLSSTWSLTDADSGTSTAPVIYEAEVPSNRPVFTGGERLTGFVLAPDGVTWQLTKPQFQKTHPRHWNFEQLYVNGRRAIQARWPNRDRHSQAVPTRGYFQRKPYPVPPPHSSANCPVPNPHYPEPWKTHYVVDGPTIMAPLAGLTPAQLADVQVTHMDVWTMSRNFIDQLDPGTGTIHLTGKNWVTPQPAAEVSRLEFLNVPFALDAPGEFYLDRTAGVLSYVPFPGEDRTTAEVIAPHISSPELVSLVGAGASRVRHVQLRNLRLRHSPYLLRRTWLDNDKFTAGYNDSYGGFSLPAAVTVSVAEQIVLEGLELAHVGGYAIWVRGGSEYVTVKDSVMYDLGGGGIKILEFDPPVAYARCRSNASSSIEMGGHHTIANNVVHSGGRSFADTVGILVSMSAHNSVVHNDVADFYNSGIKLVTIELCNPDHTNSSHHNTVRFNRVHQIGQEVLSDLGGIYFAGPNENTVASYNEVFDVRHWGHGLPSNFASTWPYTPVGEPGGPLAGGTMSGYMGTGVYLDGGARGVTVSENLVYDTEGPGLMSNPGWNRTVKNNVFALSEEWAIWLITFPPPPTPPTDCNGNPLPPPAPGTELKFESNIVYFDAYDSPSNPALRQGYLGFINGHPGSAYTFDKNLYFKIGGAPLDALYANSSPPFFGTIPFGPPSVNPSWQHFGLDPTTLVADPLFVDPSAWNFTLSPSSPALGPPVNFVPIVPPEPIGVVPTSPAYSAASRLERPGDFGGMFGFGNDPTIYGNPFYAGLPSCPPGYTESRTLGSASTDYPLIYCHRPLDDMQPLVDFGGMYGTVNGAPAPNVTTGGLNCPAGFTAQQVLGSSLDPPVHHCYRAHTVGQDAPYTFGGMFGYWYNPLTADHTPLPNALHRRLMACPQGHTPTQVLGTVSQDYTTTYCTFSSP